MTQRTMPTPPTTHRPMIQRTLIKRTTSKQPTTSNSSNRMDSQPSRHPNNSSRRCSSGSSRFSSRDYSREDSRVRRERRASRLRASLVCLRDRRTIRRHQRIPSERRGTIWGIPVETYFGLATGAFCATVGDFTRYRSDTGLEPALVSAGVGGTGLTMCKYRFLVRALPRLVREGMKNGDDGAVGG
jgi:hypothetical protein